MEVVGEGGSGLLPPLGLATSSRGQVVYEMEVGSPTPKPYLGEVGVGVVGERLPPSGSGGCTQR